MAGSRAVCVMRNSHDKIKHRIERAKERYGLELKHSEVCAIEREIRKGKSEFVRKLVDNCDLVTVVYRDVTLWAVWDRCGDRIRTFLPPGGGKMGKYDGRHPSLTEGAVYQRLRSGWDLDRAMNTPKNAEYNRMPKKASPIEEEPMQEQIPLPQGTTAKTLVCLVLWRAAKGRLGAKVALSSEEVSEVLQQMGVVLVPGIVTETYSALIQQSFVDVVRSRQGVNDVSLMKVNDNTRRQAERAAAALGTEPVPVTIGDVVELPVYEVVPEVAPPSPVEPTSNLVVAAPTPVLPEPSPKYHGVPMDAVCSFIDMQMEVLALASDASRLRARNEVLEASASHVDTEAVKEVVAVLMALDTLTGNPLGALLTQTLNMPGIVTKAKLLADRLQGAT